MRRQLSIAENKTYLTTLETDLRLTRKDFLTRSSWENVSKGKINKNQCEHWITQLAQKKKKVVVKQVSEHQFQNEGSIFARLSYGTLSPCIVNFMGCYIPDSEKASLTNSQFSKHILVYQYEANRDAFSYLKTVKHNVQIKTVVEWIENLASALEHLKEHGIVHRNITSKNCLITHDYKLKLSDFKLARLTKAVRQETKSDNKCEFSRQESNNLPIHELDLSFCDEDSPLVQWRAPETRNSTKFTCESDAWSLGVVIWEFFWRCSKRPYDDEKWDIAEIYLRLDEGKILKKPDTMPKQIYAVCQSLWKLNPADRRKPRTIVIKFQDYLKFPEQHGLAEDFNKMLKPPKQDTLHKRTKSTESRVIVHFATRAETTSTPRCQKCRRVCCYVILAFVILSLIGAAAVVFYRVEITESKPWKSFLNSVNGMIAGSVEGDEEGNLNQGGIANPTAIGTTLENAIDPTVLPSVVTETLSFNDESDISKAITEASSTDLVIPTTVINDMETVVPVLVNTTATAEAEKGGFFGFGLFDDMETGSGATTDDSTPVVTEFTDYE